MLFYSCRYSRRQWVLSDFLLHSKRKMTLKSKKGWKSVVPLRLKTKSSANFCLLPRVKSDRFGPGETPVCLNVYDLTPMNNYVYWAGFGIFHSGVEGKRHYLAFFSLLLFSYSLLLMLECTYAKYHACK